MNGTRVRLSCFPRWRSRAGRRGRQGASVLFLLAAGGLITAAPSHAAPPAPYRDGVTGLPLTLARDYCGHGFHRDNKHRNKAGAWVGKCLPNKPKQQQPPAGQAPGQPANQPPKQPG